MHNDRSEAVIYISQLGVKLTRKAFSPAHARLSNASAHPSANKVRFIFTPGQRYFGKIAAALKRPLRDLIFHAPITDD